MPTISEAGNALQLCVFSEKVINVNHSCRSLLPHREMIRRWRELQKLVRQGFCKYLHAGPADGNLVNCGHPAVCV